MKTTVRLWQIGATPRAVLFSKVPKERDAHPQGIWLPRSQIQHITRFPPVVGSWQECHVTLPEWLAEKKGLL